MNELKTVEKTLYPWHIEIWRHLRRLGSKLPHALLFYGPAGTGIDRFPETFARAMLCENPEENGYACMQCPSCRWFDQMAHPDYRPVLPEALEVARGVAIDDKASDDEGTTGKSGKEPSRKIGIDKVRSLSDFINVSTHRGGLRIVSVYPADAMTMESSNALLKMLEEPPANTLFLLTTTHPDALLPTIISRCSKVAFPMPETSVAVSWLKEQGVSEAENRLAGQGGAPVAALREAQDGDREEMTVWLEELASSDDATFLKTAEKLQKVPVTDLVTWLQRWLYDVLAIRLAGRQRYYPRYRTALEAVANRTDGEALLALLKKVNECKRVAEHPLVPRLVLEDLLLDYRKMLAR